MPEFTIRNARLADLDVIVDVYNSTIASRMVTADIDPVTPQSRIAWFNEHNDTDRPLWIVEDKSSATLGWISFQSFYGRPAYQATAEISIYLATESRGKGFGSKLLEQAIAQAPKMGISTLLGYIFAHNYPSLQLFKKHGFSVWGNLVDIAVLDGIERSLLIVGKRIR